MMEKLGIEGTQISETLEDEAIIVVSVQQFLKAERRQESRAIVDREFPGRKVLIVEGGMGVTEIGHAAQLGRIEAKLDALLTALAEDGDEDEDEECPQLDLEGNEISADRNQQESL